MPIQMQCPGCKATLQVDESLAGKQGRCIHCNRRLMVPRAGDSEASADSPPLFDAPPEEMVRELYQQNKSAMLIVFEPAADGSYSLVDVPDDKLTCIVTEDVTPWRFAQLVQSISKRFGGRRPKPTTSPLPAEFQPYELKGDPLGMILSEFKRKYARSIEGSPHRVPLCSDETWGEYRASLQTEPWHRTAGIVHARVDLPNENNSPTVAGVKTDLLLYQFVDDRLFRISAYFPTDQFHVVSEALEQKHGPPTHESSQPRQLEWENSVSSIVLARGSVHPPEPSTLQLIHKELVKAAESRVPQGAQDI